MIYLIVILCRAIFKKKNKHGLIEKKYIELLLNYRNVCQLKKKKQTSQ